MKKRIFLLVMTLIVGLTLVACAKKEGEIVDFSEVMTQRVELSVW